MAVLSEAAFNEVYRHTARPLWLYAYRVTSNASDADDIVQEAFHRLLRADLPGDEEAVRRYLFRIAGNLMTDRWRRAERELSWLERLRPRGRLPDPPAGAGDVSRTFATLKPRERALLWLAYVEQDSHETIADALGVSRGSVKVLLSRARARLRAVLAARGLAPEPTRGTAPSPTRR